MIRRRKNFRKPKKIYDSLRIEQENQIKKKYGLKNKREIWKAKYQIDDIRERAKKVLTKEYEEQKNLIDRTKKMGFEVEKIADVLALSEEDWLKRRLQTIVSKKFKIQPKQARQLITHRHILVNKGIVTIPGYIVEKDEEGSIDMNIEKKNKKQTEKPVEVKNEN
jgi:small subunit ribosomal protein S4